MLLLLWCHSRFRTNCPQQLDDRHRKNGSLNKGRGLSKQGYWLGGFKKALRGVFCRSTRTPFRFLFWAIRFGFWGVSPAVTLIFGEATPTFGLWNAVGPQIPDPEMTFSVTQKWLFRVPGKWLKNWLRKWLFSGNESNVESFLSHFPLGPQMSFFESLLSHFSWLFCDSWSWAPLADRNFWPVTPIFVPQSETVHWNFNPESCLGFYSKAFLIPPKLLGSE